MDIQFSFNRSSPLLFRREVIGRDDRIRTRDILYPKQTRYQAALHPFQLVYSVIVENPGFVFHIFISSIDIDKYLVISSFWFQIIRIILNKNSKGLLFYFYYIILFLLYLKYEINMRSCKKMSIFRKFLA